MFMNEYLMAETVRDRIAERHACAERAALVAALRPPRSRLRVAVGRALMGLGAWMLATPSRVEPRASRS